MSTYGIEQKFRTSVLGRQNFKNRIVSLRNTVTLNIKNSQSKIKDNKNDNLNNLTFSNFLRSYPGWMLHILADVSCWKILYRQFLKSFSIANLFNEEVGNAERF